MECLAGAFPTDMLLTLPPQSGMSKAKISANYIFKLRKLATEDEIVKRDIEKDDADTAPGFKFDNVRFAYERRPMHQVLKGINTQASLAKFLKRTTYHRVTNMGSRYSDRSR